MKKLIVLTVLFLFYITPSFAQLEFGMKAGLNFSTNGKLTEIKDEVVTAVTNPSSRTGFHIGMYTKIGLLSYYIRPELVYTKTKSDYDGDAFDMSKLDLPVLFGFKIIKPVSIFIGPSFQYILETDLAGVKLEDLENDFSVGFNVGAGLEFNSFGVDVRYEKGFSRNFAFIAGVAGLPTDKIDTRPEQFIISLFYKF